MTVPVCQVESQDHLVLETHRVPRPRCRRGRRGPGARDSLGEGKGLGDTDWREGQTGATAAVQWMLRLFGVTCSTLVRSGQSSSGPAGGASDGYGLGRGAAGPDRWCTTTAAGALRVIV